MSTLDAIQHIVVLMLENRSFDSMLGRLYPKSEAFDGLSGDETNPDRDSNPVRVWNAPGGTGRAAVTIPDSDPGELWANVNVQLFGTAQVRSPAPAPQMQGFVANYQSQTERPPYVPDRVMHYFTPEQVPVISTLAREFAVCDRWHASAPCQTWPNRFFVHAGTANGYENNSPPRFPYEMPTILNRFEEQHVESGWKIYFHDIPQSITLSRLWPHLERFRFYDDEFRGDARAGTLPSYAFIEPRYFTDASLPNDQHPPHAVTLGEQLIADVYNCLRSGPAWTATLLIVIYDEHGGCFDHVAPPPATPIGAAPRVPFNFDRYGVRVPAVLVSPYIRRESRPRPPGSIPFDHTSVLATLRKRFGLGPPLGRRDAVAPDLEAALNLAAPRNLGPDRVEALAYVAAPAEIARAKAVPLNAMQKSLLDLTRCLPASFDGIEAHIEALRAAAVVTAEEFNADAADATKDVTGALAAARTRLDRLFGSLLV